MGSCRSIRPLMAAALYEPLSAADRETLDRHLAHCARCSAELAALQRVTKAIPVTEHCLSVDLAPRLIATLEETRPRRSPWLAKPLWATGAVAAAILVALAAFLAGFPDQNGRFTTEIARNGVVSAPADAAPAPAPTGSTPLTPVELALDEAEALVARHAHADALLVLQDALRLHPNDPAAGLAQSQLASLEYGQLKRYPQAFDAYVKLRNQFPDVFATDNTNIARFDLLVEGWQNNFENLYALDRARNAGDDALVQFEDVLARNPGKLVAVLAMAEMAQRVTSSRLGTPDADILALEELKSRCKNPVAIAQVCLALGDAYAGRLSDPGRARSVYETVLNSGNDVLAGQAREALARLDSR